MTYSSKLKNICSLEFDLQSLQWTLLNNDNGQLPGPGGSLLSFQNHTRILYLGGYDYEGNKLRTVYELKDDNKWDVWPEKLMVAIGNDTVVHAGSEFISQCESPSLPIGKTVKSRFY